jgi:hypothetical protein
MQPWQSGRQPQDSHPYGPPQPPPQPYGQRYAPQQPSPPPAYESAPAGHAAPRPSQGLAITALALGIVAVLVALTSLRGVGMLIAVVAGVLAVIAMASKRHSGTKFAVAGLVLAMLALPVAFLMWMWATESAKSNVEQQQLMQKCIEEEPQNIIECAGLD